MERMMEKLLAAGLVCVTVGVACAFGYRQFLQLKRVRRAGANSEESRFLARSSRRRLIISCLLALVGVLIGVTYLSGLDHSVLKLGDELQNAQRRPLTPEERQVVQWYGACWIGILLLLLGIVIGVGVDLLDVRRHFQQTTERLRDDRRAMMQRQLEAMRAEHREANFNPEWN